MALREPAGDTTTTTAPRKRAAKKTAAAGSGGYTARSWAKELLTRMGFPVTAANLNAIVSWEAAEGGHWNNTAHFNPINTTIDAPGATSMNEVGVKAYTSWDQGFDATIRTLHSANAHQYGYDKILAALKAGNDAGAVVQAVVNSSWGTKQISLGGHGTYGRGAGMGGNTIVGDSGGGALGDNGPVSPKQYLAELGSQYGYLSAFWHNKEIRSIVIAAARHGWSESRMLNELEKTKFWKTTSATARSWMALKQTDPATARQQLHQQRQMIRQLAKSTLGGGELSDERINQLANVSIAAGWSQAQLQKAIGAEFDYHGAQQKYRGAAGQTVTQLQQIARQYVVPLSPHAIEHWTKQILEGTFTVQDFTAYAQQQAESLYPSIGSALKAGQTTRQYFDPYAQVWSQVLERPSDELDLSKPRWNKALLQPAADGNRMPMTLDAWAQYLRSLPEYKHTSGAKQSAADFGLALINDFGKVATPGSQGRYGDTAMNFGGA